MTTPLVSIGIPVYNAEATLPELLDSLLAQSFSDFELLISDNASTDSTPKLCERYAARDSRVVWMRYARNLGGARNFNRVCELARGRYFLWAAGDDRFRPAFLERTVNVLEADPKAVLCYSATVLLKENGEEVTTYRDAFRLTGDDPGERFETLMRGLDLANMLHGLMRTDALRATGMFQPAFHAADVAILADLALKGRFVQLDEPLFLRRRLDRPQENLEQRGARLDRWTFGEHSGKTVRLPFVALIRQHMALVANSELDPQRKAALMQSIPQVFLERFGTLIQGEIQRAIQLAGQGIYHLPWGETPKGNKAPAEEILEAAELLRDLDTVLTVFSDFPAIHLARALVLLRLGRDVEAKLALLLEHSRRPNDKATLELCKKLGLAGKDGKIPKRLEW